MLCTDGERSPALNEKQLRQKAALEKRAEKQRKKQQNTPPAYRTDNARPAPRSVRERNVVIDPATGAGAPQNAEEHEHLRQLGADMPRFGSG